jgi:ubiquinone/menaquinone biosynthesis C-methylase UbiE
MSSRVLVKSSAFDAVAATYDETFTASRIGRAQRDAVWAATLKLFRPGSRILEINCGTGVDALFLANLGHQVVGIDVSAKMIEVARQRVSQHPLRHQIRLLQWSVEDLDCLPNGDSYDGVFSNFGGLNCVADLEKFAHDLSRLVKAGSPVILCLLGRYCLWEILYYSCRFRLRKAARRLKPSGTVADFGNGAVLRVFYPSVRGLVRSLQPYFRYRDHQAIGLTVPPSFLEGWASRHPRFLAAATQIDRKLAPRPVLRSAGDHYLVRLERADE